MKARLLQKHRSPSYEILRLEAAAEEPISTEQLQEQ